MISACHHMTHVHINTMFSHCMKPSTVEKKWTMQETEKKWRYEGAHQKEKGLAGKCSEMLQNYRDAYKQGTWLVWVKKKNKQNKVLGGPPLACHNVTTTLPELIQCFISRAVYSYLSGRSTSSYSEVPKLQSPVIAIKKCQVQTNILKVHRNDMYEYSFL